jgi:hypothetical protein
LNAAIAGHCALPRRNATRACDHRHLQGFDEQLQRLDTLFVGVLETIEHTPDQRAHWPTQATHWQGGGDRECVQDYEDLVRLHAELRQLMHRRLPRARMTTSWKPPRAAAM